MEPFIRKYNKDDRENLRNICIETAGDFFRKSDNLLNSVPILYNDYFTKYEPQNIFVVDDGFGKAVGYIVCAADVKHFRRKLTSEIIPNALKSDKGMFPACMGYVGAMILEGKKNGVHLHIDILPDFQHMGFGKKLIDELRNHLFESGIPALSVNTIERDTPAYRFYIKYGFKENIHYPGGLVSLIISTNPRKE